MIIHIRPGEAIVIPDYRPEPIAVPVAAPMPVIVAAVPKISKPRDKATPKADAPKLNAVGKPYSPSYDPAYRMKYKPSGKAGKCPPRTIHEHEYLAHMRQTRGPDWKPSWQQPQS